MAHGVGIAGLALNWAMPSMFVFRAMNDLASDSVPLVTRGFLLALVVCLHAAGAAAFSRLSSLPRHNDEPMVLRASWINISQPAPSLLPAQPTEPVPIVPPVSPPRQPRATAPSQPRVKAPSQPQPAAVQSIPAVVEDAPDIPVDPPTQDDSTPDLQIDVSAAVAAAAVAAGGTVAGDGDDRGGEGSRDLNYVGPDFNASYFSNPEPEYPPQSRRLREQGLVKLRVHVTVDGRVGEVTLHKSSGYERLDKAALDTVRHWRFRPAQRAGIPVAGWVVVPIRFELQG